MVAAKMRTHEGRDMDGAGAANRFGSETGEVVLDAVMRWREWVHRRVESVQPLDGDRGRIRHSIDCTPPPDARLAYEPRERKRRLSRVEGDAIVPLAMVAKGPMRHLDATGSDGRALPLLTMNDGQAIAFSVLTWALGREGIATSSAVNRALRAIVGPEGPRLEAAIESLAEDGTWAGEQLWRGHQLSVELGDLLRDLGRSFLLVALVPAAHLGRRQILKFSFHWEVRPPVDTSPLTRLARPLVAFGLTTATLTVPMMNASDAESYHLEFRTPPELDCVALTLLGGASPTARDVGGEAVAHAHGRFETGHASTAEVELRVRRRGAWRLTWAAALVTSAISVFAVALPGAASVLRDSENGGSALMLAAPALLIGLAAARRESSLSSWMLSPLRSVNVAFALGLFAMAGSIVGGLVAPWIDVLWWTVASVSTVVALLLTVANRVRASGVPPVRPGYSGTDRQASDEGERHVRS
ncbi:hypothetical protein [Frigoribacterium sp. PhB107]|uniref:hypothetical protein n=1 Tax=Frigoribacterium sp. PhB107 TaxID=2485172 RepID=UPI0011CD8CDE|nr:hypothetical protein [Frigoribacterium sp. PhB107]